MPIALWRQQLRDSRMLIAFEFLLVGGVFVADRYHHIYFSKTPYLIALGWVSLTLRGLRWRDLGLGGSPDWKRLVIIGFIVGVLMELLELFATQPLLVALTGQYPDLSVFRNVVGNGRLLAFMIAGSWILAALGEELVWRGYMMNRISDLFGHATWGTVPALIIASVWFGFAHASQDMTGVIENSINGVLLGSLYLFCGRNLIAPIVAHGMTDTIDSLILFSGHYPGMQ